jgi:hypothetical protein
MRPQAQPMRPQAAAHPNPAMQQRPAANQATQHPGQPARQAQQAHPAEQHRPQAAAVHPEHPGAAAQNHMAALNRPAEPGHPAEARGGMQAGHVPAMAAGLHPGASANQPRFNEHVRDPAREHTLAAAHEHDFHTHDVRRFSAQERDHWRGGHWHNDWHSGRFGWWYEVDDVWYAYPAPVFPYPLAVAPIVVEDAVGPVVEAQQPVAAAAVIAIAPLPPLPRAAYHCGNPEGFFPLVEECSADWVAVGAH